MQTQISDQTSSVASNGRFHETTLLGILLVIGLLVGTYSESRAADITWTNGTASYNNAANWSPNQIPGSGDNAINNNGTNNAVQINAGDPAWTVVDPLVGTVEGASGAFEQNGSSLTANGWFRLGLASNSVAAYTLNDGTLNLPNRIQTGEGANSSTEIHINGGVINKTGGGLGLNFSDGGWGGQHSATTRVVQTAGTINSDGEFWIGQFTGGVGTYDFHGGTINQSNWFVVARAGAVGTLTMDGGIINKYGGGNFIVGDNSLGILNFSAGTINCSGEFWIGQAGNGRGTNNMSGTAALNVLGNWMAVGRDNGTGELNLSDNVVVNHTGNGNQQVLTLAGIGSSTGIINQDAGVVTNTTSDTWVGENGTGIWNLNSGNAVLGYVQLGRAASANGTFNLNGGELSATEITSGGGLGTFNFNGGTLRASASSVNFMHDIDVADIGAAGAIIDTDGYDVTIAQALSDLFGSMGGLTKNGSGTLILNGANYYYGPTVINDGTLISGTTGYTSGGLTVADGAGFGVQVSTYGSQIYPASLTLGASGATSLDFDFGAFGSPASAPISLSGNLAINSTITVNIQDAPLQVGQFPLISYVTKSGSGSFVMGSLPEGVAASIVDSGFSIDLNVTQVDAYRWSGSENGDWDIETTANWVNTGTGQPTTYSDGKPTAFDDTATGSTSINITTNVSPKAVILENDSLNYAFNGSGKITGATRVTKRGAGIATMANTGGNDYTGGTRIEGGTLAVTNLANGGSPSAIGASSSDPANLVLAGGTLQYSGPSVSIDRGYSVGDTNSAIQTDTDLTLTGSVEASADTTFLKTGVATLSYAGTGTNLIGRGGVAANLPIGFVGWAAYNLTDGTVVMDGTSGGLTNRVQGEFWVGGTLESGAALVMNNAALETTSWVSVGRGNGTSNFLSSITLQDSSISLAGGGFSAGWDAELPLNLGYQIHARQEITLNGDSAIAVRNGSIFIGERRGSTATLLLNDTSSMSCTARAGIGIGSGGSLEPNSGTVEIADSAIMSGGAWYSIGHEGGTGTVLVKENGQLYVGGDLNVTDVGNGCVGTLTAQDNAVIYANRIYVGKDTGVDGVFNILDNATVVSTNDLRMARFYTYDPRVVSNAVVNLAGGSLAVSHVEGAVTNGNQGTFNFNGGRLIARNPDTANFMYDLAAINVMSGGATIDSAGFDIAIAEPLLDAGGGGGLTKVGAGTLSLNGTNTYTGATMVNEGSLGGNGAINGLVSVAAGGTLTPGTSVGTLTINGGLSLAGNTLIEVDKALTQSNDVVNVSGALNYGGILTVANIGAGALQIGDTFTVFPTGGSGAFTSIESSDAVFAFNNGVLTVVGLAAPELTWSNQGNGVVEFSWSAGSKLVYQTNSLGSGLSTNWMDYPDTSNPVMVTNNPAVPSTFFGLQPE